MVNARVDDTGERRSRTGWRIALPIGIALGLVGGAAGYALAVDSGSSTASTANTASTADDTDRSEGQADDESGGAGWWQHKMAGGDGGPPWGAWGDDDWLDPSSLLRGEIILDGDNGTETVHIQRGEVRDATAEAITVESADGHTATYAVTDDTSVKGSVDDTNALADGDPVIVAGTDTDDAMTAKLVLSHQN